MFFSQNRPFSRSLVKLGFTIFAGKRRAHFQDCWPGLCIERDDSGAGKIHYRGRMAGVLLPTGLPQGLSEINIVGSGPSLAKQRIECLAPNSAILLNGAIALAGKLQPLAIAVEDERFVWRHIDILRNAPDNCLYLLSPAAMRAWLSLDQNALEGRSIMLIDNIFKPVHLPRRSAASPELTACLALDTETGAALSLDPAVGVVIAGTVACSAVQFALNARPGRIGLAGIDLSNANQPRFYEREGSSAFSGIVSGLQRILRAFSLVHSVAEAAGVSLVCYSPVSALLEIGLEYDDKLDKRSSQLANE